MTDDEIREHAERLIELHNDHYEFCLVYEDDELADASEEDQEKILDAMYEADVQVWWP